MPVTVTDRDSSKSVAAPQMFYFGPWDEAGHYLSDERGRSVGRNERGALPWNEWRGDVDGVLQPHPEDTCASRRRHYPSTYCDCGRGPEGIAMLHHKDGWTALSFWDRSVDKRGACNSTYFAEGTFSFEEMVEMAKTRFAYRWNKMDFEVREAAPHRPSAS